MPTFIRAGKMLLNADGVQTIDCSSLEEGVIILHHERDGAIVLRGIEAIDAIMTLKPSAIEGRRMRFIRHHWAFHNLFAHPLLQICAWLGLPQLGFKIHDATTPRPKH